MRLLAIVALFAACAFAQDEIVGNFIVKDDGSGNKARIFVGLSSTDASIAAGSVVAKNVLMSVTATTNASLGSFAAIAGNYVALSSSHTGSGTDLPMAFFIAGSERARFDTSGNFGVGVSPSQFVHFRKDQNTNTIALVENQTSGSAAQADFRVLNNLGTIAQFGIYSSTTTAYGALAANDVHVYSTSNLDLMADNPSGVIKFATGGNAEKMRLDASGNLGIGTTPSFRLDVAGSERLAGDLTFDLDNSRKVGGLSLASADMYSYRYDLLVAGSTAFYWKNDGSGLNTMSLFDPGNTEFIFIDATVSPRRVEFLANLYPDANNTFNVGAGSPFQWKNGNFAGTMEADGGYLVGANTVISSTPKGYLQGLQVCSDYPTCAGTAFGAVFVATRGGNTRVSINDGGPSGGGNIATLDSTGTTTTNSLGAVNGVFSSVGFSANGTAGITSNTCSHWSMGLCTSP